MLQSLQAAVHRRYHSYLLVCSSVRLLTAITCLLIHLPALDAAPDDDAFFDTPFGTPLASCLYRSARLKTSKHCVQPFPFLSKLLFVSSTTSNCHECSAVVNRQG